MVTALQAYDEQLRARFSGKWLRPLTAAEQDALAAIDGFAIVFSNRSGSTLLADSLYRRGLPVPPQVEVFNADLVGEVCGREGKDCFTDYFLSTVTGWASGGTCGFKAGPQQIEWLLREGFLDRFRSLSLLRVRRRDRVAQAVSLFIARQTGRWHAGMQGGPGARDIAYDGAAIAGALADLAAMEEDIDALIARHGLRTREVVYEELVRDPEAVLAACCAFVGWTGAAPQQGALAVAPLRSQWSAVNASFRARFLRENPGAAAGT